MTSLKSAREPINKLQIMIGVVSLLVGTLVYFLDRPAEGTYFIYRIGFMSRLHNMIHGITQGSFGSVGTWLPEFVHVFSFILLTAGIISCKKRGYVIICIAWFLIDSLFELGQRYSSISLRLIPDWFSHVPVLESVKGYFRKGTFDLRDMIAIVGGTVAAYLVLLITTFRDNKIRSNGRRY